MMKKLNFSCLTKAIVIVLLLSSCNGVRKKLPEFNGVNNVIADKVTIHEIIMPDFMTKTNDKLIVSSSESDPMIYIYSLPDLVFRNSIGNKGRGPDELSSFPMFCKSMSDDYLYVWGYTLTSMKRLKFDENDRLINDTTYNLPRYEEFNYMHVVKDSILIYYLADNLTIKKYDLINEKYLEEIKYDIEDESGMGSFYYSNRGVLSANDSYMVYAYRYKRQIDIYDVNTFKLKTQIIAKDSGYKDIVNYVNAFCGKKYFYLLYRGVNKNDWSSNTDTLEVYDYNGNPVKKYQFDKSPLIFVIDEDNSLLFGYSYTDDEEPDTFLRFDI